MSRKKCSVSDKVGKLLVNQLAHELKNFNLYKAIANYFSVEDIDNIAEYYHKRAAEELHHHDWIFEYLTDADYKFDYPDIPSNGVKFNNWLEPFQLTVDREIETTNLIYTIYEAARDEKDYMTMLWLERPLLLEQIEEESTSRTALGIMETDVNIYKKADQILKLLE